MAIHTITIGLIGIQGAGRLGMAFPSCRPLKVVEKGGRVRIKLEIPKPIHHHQRRINRQVEEWFGTSCKVYLEGAEKPHVSNCLSSTRLKERID
jgi:hypothetical protein